MISVSVFLAAVLYKATPSQECTWVCVYTAMPCPDILMEVEDEGIGDEEEEQDQDQDLTISPLSLMSTKETVRLCQDVHSSSQSSEDMPSEPK